MNAVVAEQRVFEAKPAVREEIGLLIGIVGPSSSGKTKSALRLADGIRSVVGGDIDFIDTENRRALAYADKHRFNHVDFQKPFSPLDYLAAIRYCAKRGKAKTIIVDSGSHEHEGPGGVLEWHEAETQRLAKSWGCKPEKAQMAAWGTPKAARRRLINEVLQMNVNVIWTFRAKEKIKIVPGKDPVPLGWQPICGEEFMYEFALQCLLPPGSKGVPRWKSELQSEAAIMKLPEHLEHVFKQEGQQLSEDIGRQLAEWAVGGIKLTAEASELIELYTKCEDEKTFKDLDKRRAAIWTDSKKLPPPSKARVKAAVDAALERIANPQPSAAESSSAPSAPASSAPSVETWVTTLRGQEDVAELDKAWKSCEEAFNGDAPNECHAAYTERREVLAEQAKQLEL